MKAAVYCGTRNLYRQMITAAKSLLIHSDVDKIYFLIEDDDFPYSLPPEIECLCVKEQDYFNPNGPNYNQRWTYMVLIRAALSKIFPHLDTILSLDVDTIVNENISDLWDLDLSDYYLAGVRETKRSSVKPYINMGVVLFNLKKLREDKLDNKIIDALNTYYYKFNEQDCINEYCADAIYLLPSDYNVSPWSDPPAHEKIVHFAAVKDWESFPLVQQYRMKPFVRNKQDTISLDIIIPTYKNKEGLRRTLDSIPNRDDINIIVVDDASDLDYNDILLEYPHIFLYLMLSNQGPGIAKQCGLKYTNAPYVTFIDTGDYYASNAFEIIFAAIKENTYMKFFKSYYIIEEGNEQKIMTGWDDKTIGFIYRRDFIDLHNITFCADGSYANEDFGFNSACRLVTHQGCNFPKMFAQIPEPIVYEHIEQNSLTRKNDNEFLYRHITRGLSINAAHAVQIARKNRVHLHYILTHVCDTMVQLYYYYLCAKYENPTYLPEVLNNIKEYYFSCYRTYEKYTASYLDESFSRIGTKLIHNRISKWHITEPININRFLCRDVQVQGATP